MYPIPYLGVFYVSKPVDYLADDALGMFMARDPAPWPRFAVQIGDDGLEGLGIATGDYLIFRLRQWVNGEGEIVFAWIDGEAIVRLAWNIWSDTVTLSASGARYPDISVSRELLIITGVCGNVRKHDDDVQLLAV
ncbi:MAG: hypothetical protein K6T83_16600 [Alicyclobacillus sp.]|nr:hypothetical protein [Alicyclobacillus sp.]